MHNLGAWLTGISGFIEMLVEHPHLRDDPNRRGKALALIVAWLAIAVAVCLMVLAGGILLVEAVALPDDLDGPASFAVFAVSFMLIFVVSLYGPKVSLALLQRRARRSEDQGRPD